MAFDEADDSGDISSADGVAVVLRFSRAQSAGLTIGSVDYVAINDSSTAPSVSYADFQVHTDGTAKASSGSSTPSFVTEYTWLGGGETNSDYEVRLVTNGNPVPGGTSSLSDTWLSCSSVSSWEWTKNTSGSLEDSYTIEYREAATGVVLASGTVHISFLVF